MQTIERESKRCGELVKNLLTFSRQKASEREPNDLNTIVDHAVLLVKHKLEMQNIELVERFAEGLPPVDCDANQIQQVALVLMIFSFALLLTLNTLQGWADKFQEP